MALLILLPHLVPGRTSGGSCPSRALCVQGGPAGRALSLPRGRGRAATAHLVGGTEGTASKASCYSYHVSPAAQQPPTLLASALLCQARASGAAARGFCYESSSCPLLRGPLRLRSTGAPLCEHVHTHTPCMPVSKCDVPYSTDVFQLGFLVLNPF